MDTTIFLGTFMKYEDQEQVFHITLLQWIYPTFTLLEEDHMQFVFTSVFQTRQHCEVNSRHHLLQ